MVEESLNPEESAELARLMMNLLDEWGLEAEDRIRLLNLPEDTRTRAIKKFRQGQPLPNETDLMQRAKLLLEINEGLQKMFPQNPILARYWVTTSNTSFGDVTPLAIMIEEGLAGIVRVHSHLIQDDAW